MDMWRLRHALSQQRNNLPAPQFRLVGAMVTNFHLPRSSLLMVVSAFAGWERILAAYQAAIQEGYRFYSFGDAC